jgi:hypothetical protein
MEHGVATVARGTFEVKINPLTTYENAEGSPLGRLSIDKQFKGDLEATSKGEMLSAGGRVKGSAGYVAIERVRGSLRGKSGTFVLQHSGRMTRGAPELTLREQPVLRADLRLYATTGLVPA